MSFQIYSYIQSTLLDKTTSDKFWATQRWAHCYATAWISTRTRDEMNTVNKSRKKSFLNSRLLINITILLSKTLVQNVNPVENITKHCCVSIEGGSFLKVGGQKLKKQGPN